jgi:hypothetical protein
MLSIRGLWQEQHSWQSTEKNSRSWRVTIPGGDAWDPQVLNLCHIHLACFTPVYIFKISFVKIDATLFYIPFQSPKSFSNLLCLLKPN